MSLLFYIVYSALQGISSFTGLSYESVNVLVWYFIIPAIFLFLIDRIIHKTLLLPIFLAAVAIFCICAGDLETIADQIFEKSVNFLLGFSRYGIGYDLASVIVCVWIPLFVFLILSFLAYPRWFKRHAPTLTSRFRWEKEK